MDDSEGEGTVEFKIKTEEFIIKEDDDPRNELTTNENKLIVKEDDSEAMYDSEGSIKFKIKSEEFIIKDEVDDSAYELTTTEENKDNNQNGNEPSHSAILDLAKHKCDTSEKLPFKCKECQQQFTENRNLTMHMLTHDGYSVNTILKTMDNSEDSIDFKIKSEELIIKDEVDDLAYELTTIEENYDLSKDQRQFVIIKSDIGPPHHIFDRFANILIKVDSSISCSIDLNKILNCCIQLVNLPENVASSKIQVNSENQNGNESSHSAILDQAKQEWDTSKKMSYKCKECQQQFTENGNLTMHMLTHDCYSVSTILKMMDNSEGSIEFKIKSEELIIKDEVDDLAYELTTTEENNDSSEDQRQFVIMESDSGPPYHIMDRFTNIVIKVNTSNLTKEDLNGMITCYVELVRHTTSKLQGRSEEQTLNKSHIILPSNSTNHKCYNCGKCFPQKGNLKKHMLIHKGKKAYECQLCNKAFTFKSSLKKHMLIHDGIKAYECQLCKKAFSDNSHLKRHMLIHEGTKAYECQLCKKSFITNSHLKQHMLIHEVKKAYECQLCKKGFTFKGNLKEHMLIHEGKKAYECQLCKKAFTYKSTLKKHMLTHVVKKAYECQLCKKSFITNSYFKNHMLIHEGKKAYECRLCKKSFITNSNLKQHMLIHESKRTYECQLCKKAFTFKGNLKGHMLIHEGKKAYECQLCKKSFITNSKLKQHMLFHEGKRAYECQLCKKSFITNSNLKQHLLFHDVKKAYECQLCKKCFITNSHLKQHMLIHKGKKASVPLVDRSHR